METMMNIPLIILCMILIFGYRDFITPKEKSFKKRIGNLEGVTLSKGNLIEIIMEDGYKVWLSQSGNIMFEKPSTLSSWGYYGLITIEADKLQLSFMSKGTWDLLSNVKRIDLEYLLSRIEKMNQEKEAIAI